MKKIHPAATILLLLFSLFASGQASLPLSRTVWNTGEPAGWTNSGCTPRTTSFACSGNNATSFDDSGDSRTIYFSGTPTILEFSLKTSGMSGPSFMLVEESSDGVLYDVIGNYGSDLSSIPLISNTCNQISINLSSTTRYVRWTYTKSTGNCDLDDVSILTTPKFYRSVATGNWNSGSSWEWSEDNAIFTPAGGGPSKLDNSVIIRNGHTISITAAASMKNASIQSGGILRVATTSGFEIAGSGDNLVIESGGLLSVDVAGTPGDITGTGTARVKSNGTVEIVATGSGTAVGDNYLALTSKFTYEHDAVFDWKVSTTTLGNNNYFKTDAAFFVPILRISVSPGFAYGGGAASTINGRLECNAVFQLQGAGDKTFTGGISGTGTVTQLSGGDIILPSTSATLEGSVTLNVLNLGLRFPVGVVIPASANIVINGPEDATIEKLSGSFKVDGIADVRGLSILNTGMGNVEINGTLKTTNQSGFWGTSATVISGAVTLNPGSTIEFSRADGLGQIVNFRTDYKNIKLSGSGSKIPSSAFNPFGNVIITGAAVFDCTGINVGDANTGLVMDGGRLIVSTTGTNPSMSLLPYNITGGTVQFAGSGGSAQTIRNQTYQHIEVTGSNVANSSGNITLNNAGTFTVKTGGAFSINDNSITGPSGTQTVTLEAGSIFRTGNNQGFSGFTASFSDNSSVHANIENIVVSPTSTIEYTRGGSTPNQPITVGSGWSYGNLHLSGLGSKIAPAGILEIKGNLTGDFTAHTFVHNGGTVLFSGTSAQTYTTPGYTFYNITNSNTVSLNINSELKLIRKLNMQGNARLHVGAFFRLLSSDTATASIGKIALNNAITYGGMGGRFVVERYIATGTAANHHSKSWQFLAVPTHGMNQTIKAAWQEGATALAQNPSPGYGTIITGHVPANGFDIYTPAGPSMKTFDPATLGWEGIPNTDLTTISNSKGYMLMVRGDRTVTTSSATATPTILRTAGRIYSPGTDAPYTSTVASGGFQSVGNPYASAIDFNQVTKSGSVDNVYYVWDPRLTQMGVNSAWGLGAYQTFTWNGSGYDVTPGGGSYTSGDYFIQSGQAFIYKSFSGGGTLTFTENCKVDDDRLVHRDPVPFDVQQIRTSLYVQQNNRVLIDGVRNQFDRSFNDAIDGADAGKISNTGENFGILSQGALLAVERRGIPAAGDTIHFKLGQVRAAHYTLGFVSNFNASLKPVLVDRYKGTSTRILPGEEIFYEFEISGDPASAASNRFYIVFRRAASLHITLNGKALENENELSWTVQNADEVSRVELLRSIDGRNFSTVFSQDHNGEEITAVYNDDAIMLSAWYRVDAITTSGRVKGNILYLERRPSVDLYVAPNPVRNVLNLYYRDLLPGVYNIDLVASDGRKALKRTVHLGRSGNTGIALSSNVAPGIYTVIISGKGIRKEIRISVL